MCHSWSDPLCLTYEQDGGGPSSLGPHVYCLFMESPLQVRARLSSCTVIVFTPAGALVPAPVRTPMDASISVGISSKLNVKGRQTLLLHNSDRKRMWPAGTNIKGFHPSLNVATLGMGDKFVTDRASQHPISSSIDFWETDRRRLYPGTHVGYSQTSFSEVARDRSWCRTSSRTPGLGGNSRTGNSHRRCGGSALLRPQTYCCCCHRRRL